MRHIPLYSSALPDPYGAIMMNEAMEIIEAPPILRTVKDAYSVRVSGETMEPRYFSVEIVCVHPTMPIKHGDFIIAQMPKRAMTRLIRAI